MSIWFSAPLGILIAEFCRRSLDRRAAVSAPGGGAAGVAAGG